MTSEQTTLQADLAFLRALVEGSGRPDLAPGKFLVATGLIWAFDALVHWVHYVWLVPMTVWQRVAFDGVVTTVWLSAAASMVAATSIPTFIALAGLAMLLLMALPGAIMWRAAQEVRP